MLRGIVFRNAVQIRCLSGIPSATWSRKQDRRSTNNRHYVAFLGGATAACVLAGGAYIERSKRRDTFEVCYAAELPTYSSADVSKHNSTKAGGIWVTYDGGVYDVTEFVKVHPGGDKILLAAGGALEPFWNLYAVHKTDEVKEILEELRIGNLDPSDVTVVSSLDSSDPYSNDPKRHPALKVVSAKPFNAETPVSLLADSFDTPNDLFFVRNHLPVPKVDPASYKLQIATESSGKTISLSLSDLTRRFKTVDLDASIQCTGNRRDEMNPIKKVKGLEWGGGAISNAKWSGVKLKDVFDYYKIHVDPSLHIQFEGLDSDPVGQRYGASIPADRLDDVLLAYQMNGEPLPPDHGYPLRAIVPGVVGARNVKWLASIRVSKEESKSHWQQNDYKMFSPSTDWDTVDFTKSPAIQESPVQSAITEPIEGTKLNKGTSSVTVRGYAFSGGGRGIQRVDVSADGGKTWQVAKLRQAESQSLRKMFAWTLFEVDVTLPPKSRDIELICKAVDSSCNVQPDNVAGVWNLRGCLNNAWNRVRVQRQ